MIELYEKIGFFFCDNELLDYYAIAQYTVVGNFVRRVFAVRSARLLNVLCFVLYYKHRCCMQHV
jgi:hypothetical protein